MDICYTIVNESLIPSLMAELTYGISINSD